MKFVTLYRRAYNTKGRGVTNVEKLTNRIAGIEIIFNYFNIKTF